MTVSAHRAFVHENLLGVKGVRSQIDTGCNFDGVVTPKLFQRWNTPPGTEACEIRFLNDVFTGGHYTNVILHGDGPNLIGLGFLARHLGVLAAAAQEFPIRRRAWFDWRSEFHAYFGTAASTTLPGFSPDSLQNASRVSIPSVTVLV